MHVREVRCFHLWMVSPTTIKSKSNRKTNIKTAFIFPWGTFAYKKMPFGLKNAGATFQRAMNFAFHDIKSIVEPYLDDLPAHSRKRIQHPDHLRLIFERCRYYKICLNPHKCVFCVDSRRVLVFIVSSRGIRVDPLKVEAIVNLPPPRSIRQLQTLEGNSNFLDVLLLTMPRLLRVSCAC